MAPDSACKRLRFSSFANVTITFVAEANSFSSRGCRKNVGGSRVNQRRDQFAIHPLVQRNSLIFLHHNRLLWHPQRLQSQLI